MENIRAFLEGSTIHGLTYIASTRKFVRAFWILVVITGFSGAAVLIHMSFQAWEESPVSTTIETIPITELTFPKVTVCPPKNSYTDLNYDLMMINNMTLNKTTRDELSNYALKLLNHGVISNLDFLQDKERFYNWYYGYTQISVPYYKVGTKTKKERNFFANTFAFNGSFSSQYFGEKFDGDKVEKTVRYEIRIYPPQSYNINGTLHVKIELIQMKDFFGRKLGDNIDINANARRNNGIRKSFREAFNKKNTFFGCESSPISRNLR